MFEQLRQRGFDVAISNHAGAILSVDFPDQVRELEDALLAGSIPIEELIGSGGGEALSTQRLRRALALAGWPKHNFRFQIIVDGREVVAASHEIDHVRRTEAGTIALEIEWNNKDPFFDRDLENFQRLHAQSAISIGVMVTRGASLQAGLVDMVERCLIKHGVIDEPEMLALFKMKDRTRRQRDAVERLVARQVPFAKAFAQHFCADKFGQATTHWSKLKERIDRGVGNPCPLVMIGLPASMIKE